MGMSADAPFIIGTADPEIAMLQGMVFGLHHFNARDLTMRHLKVLVATELFIRTFKVEPTRHQIAVMARIKDEDDMEPEFSQLVALRYLYENVPTFGDVYTYRLGQMGGTAITHILKQGLYEKPKKAPPRLRARRGARTEGNSNVSRRPSP